MARCGKATVDGNNEITLYEHLTRKSISDKPERKR